MTKLSGILLVSLALNAALAVAVFRQSPPGTAAQPTTPAPVPATTPEHVAAPAAKTFQWSLLGAEDLKKYTANLRAFGTPEKVVRDIIMADIAKMYRPKFAAVRGQKHVPDEKFWEHPPGRPQPLFDQTKEQRDQERTLRREQNELVKSLLGEDVFRQIAKDSGLPDAAGQPDIIPPGLTDKVEEIRSRYQDAENDLMRDSNGGYDEFADEEQQKLERQLHTDLAGILTPEQLKEYELRTSQMADQMRGDLKWFEPNEQEFRSVFDFRQATAAYDSSPLPPTVEQFQAAFDKEKPLIDALVRAIGTNRANEYFVTSAGVYRNLLEAGVPKESVMKVADIRKQSTAAARQIRADQSLTPEQRTEKLKALQTGAQKELQTLLNEQQFKPYLNQGGSWVRSLAPND